MNIRVPRKLCHKIHPNVLIFRDVVMGERTAYAFPLSLLFRRNFAMESSSRDRDLLLSLSSIPEVVDGLCSTFASIVTRPAFTGASCPRLSMFLKWPKEVSSELFHSSPFYSKSCVIFQFCRPLHVWSCAGCAAESDDTYWCTEVMLRQGGGVFDSTKKQGVIGMSDDL